MEGERLGRDSVRRQVKFKGGGAERLGELAAGHFEAGDLDRPSESGFLKGAGDFDVGGDGAFGPVSGLDGEAGELGMALPSERRQSCWRWHRFAR